MATNQTFQAQSLRVQSQTLLDSYTLFMLFVKHSLDIKFLNFTTDSSFSNVPHIKQQAAFYANRNLFLTSNMLIRNNVVDGDVDNWRACNSYLWSVVLSDRVLSDPSAILN